MCSSGLDKFLQARKKIELLETRRGDRCFFSLEMTEGKGYKLLHDF